MLRSLLVVLLGLGTFAAVACVHSAAVSDGGADVGARDPTLPCGRGIRAEVLDPGGDLDVDGDAVMGAFVEDTWVVEWRSRGTDGARQQRLTVFESTTARGSSVPVPDLPAAFWLSSDTALRVELGEGAGLRFSVREWQHGALSPARDTLVIDDPAWVADEFGVCEGDTFSAHLMAEPTSGMLGLVMVDWRTGVPVAASRLYVPAAPGFGIRDRIPGPGVYPARIAGCVARADGELLVGVVRGGREPRPMIVRLSTIAEPMVALVGDATTPMARVITNASGEPLYFVGQPTRATMFDALTGAPVAAADMDGVSLEDVAHLRADGFSLFVLGAGRWVLPWSEVGGTFAVPLRGDGACRLDRGVSRRDGDAVEVLTRCQVGVTRTMLHRVRICGSGA